MVLASELGAVRRVADSCVPLRALVELDCLLPAPSFLFSLSGTVRGDLEFIGDDAPEQAKRAAAIVKFGGRSTALDESCARMASPPSPSRIFCLLSFSFPRRLQQLRARGNVTANITLLHLLAYEALLLLLQSLARISPSVSRLQTWRLSFSFCPPPPLLCSDPHACRSSTLYLVLRRNRACRIAFWWVLPVAGARLEYMRFHPYRTSAGKEPIAAHWPLRRARSGAPSESRPRHRPATSLLH